MDLILEILINFSVLFVGVLVLVGIMIYKSVARDKKLNIRKLVNENKTFWIVTIVLGLILCIATSIVPEIKSTVGIVANLDSKGGYFGLGYVLAQGTDITPLFKKLNQKFSSNDGETN